MSLTKSSEGGLAYAGPVAWKGSGALELDLPGKPSDHKSAHLRAIPGPFLSRAKCQALVGP